MITVASFDNTEQAELLRIRLEEGGIQACVTDAAIVSLNWMYSNAVGGVKVQIADRDAEKAKRLLEDIRRNTPPPEPLSTFTCPHCGSTKVEYRRISKRFFMLSLLLLGVPLALYHPRHHCLDCCKTW